MLGPEGFSILEELLSQELIYCGPSRKLNLWRPTHVGGGLEYRFTPHIGIFGENAYAFPNLSNNNFIQTNFGLRSASQAKN
jgi:hypothetical protein